MRKASLFLIVFCCILLFGCGKQEVQPLINEERNKEIDESNGVTNGIYFLNFNLSASEFTVRSTNEEITFGWKFNFHDNFYKRLIENNETFFYKLRFSDVVAKLIGVNETDIYAFEPFVEGGKTEYSVSIPVQLDSPLTENDLEIIKNDLKYTLLYYNKDSEVEGTTSLNKDSWDRTQYYQ